MWRGEYRPPQPPPVPGGAGLTVVAAARAIVRCPRFLPACIFPRQVLGLTFGGLIDLLLLVALLLPLFLTFLALLLPLLLALLAFLLPLLLAFLTPLLTFGLLPSLLLHIALRVLRVRLLLLRTGFALDVAARPRLNGLRRAFGRGVLDLGRLGRLVSFGRFATSAERTAGRGFLARVCAHTLSLSRLAPRVPPFGVLALPLGNPVLDAGLDSPFDARHSGFSPRVSARRHALLDTSINPFADARLASGQAFLVRAPAGLGALVDSGGLVLLERIFRVAHTFC